jgi:DNA polymerase III psi subunit
MNQEIFETTYQEEVYQIRPRPIVVINEAWDHLGEKELELLSKIISALKISIDSVTIITQPSFDITSFKGKTLKLIYFGDLPEGVSRYEILESHGLSFICSVSLTQLLENEQARKQLWAALKKLFSV